MAALDLYRTMKDLKHTYTYSDGVLVEVEGRIESLKFRGIDSPHVWQYKGVSALELCQPLRVRLCLPLPSTQHGLQVVVVEGEVLLLGASEDGARAVWNSLRPTARGPVGEKRCRGETAAGKRVHGHP